MLYKQLRIEIKEVTDEGAFTGYAAVFNNVDLGGDTIAPGAFAKTIVEKSDHPVLWGHNPREVIGVNKSYAEDGKGLLVHGQLILDVQRAKEARALLKAGAVKGMSIGYDTVKDELDHETGVRTLKEVKLWEYSFTPFPMNPEASVVEVKSFDDFDQQLRAITQFLERQKSVSSDRLERLDAFAKKVSALQAAKALEAATHDDSKPELLHLGSSFDSLDSYLKGMSNGN